MEQVLDITHRSRILPLQQISFFYDSFSLTMQRSSFLVSLLTPLLSLLLGGFFVVSGIGKLLDVEAFSWVMNGYGLGSVAWIAVFVPPAEVLLGLALAFGIRLRLYAALSLVLLLMFTAGFAVAYFGHGVQDCGCFGAITVLKTSPAISFARNGLLLLLAAVLWCVAPDEVLPLTRWQQGMMIVLAIVLFTASGVSYRKPLLSVRPFLGEKISQTPLQSLLSAGRLVSPQDSTMFVFIFGASCSHCWNMTANVKEFAASGVAGRVVAIAGGDSTELARYQAAFRPNFPIVLVPAVTVEGLVSRLPTAFVVRGGAVEQVFEGEVPSPQTLERMRSGRQ